MTPMFNLHWEDTVHYLQNDKKDLQDQLKQLTQQLSNLKVQNSHLSSKHTMLETDLLSQEALVAQTLV